MGVWKATEEIATVLTDNLSAKIAEVAAEESLTLYAGFALYKRTRAENSFRREKATVSIWTSVAQTRAASQTRRRWKVLINIDYTFQGQDREAMGEQIELTLDAIMRCIDLIPEETVTVSAASEEPFATITLTDIDDLLQESAGDISQGSPFFAGVRLTIPIVQHENLPT